MCLQTQETCLQSLGFLVISLSPGQQLSDSLFLLPGL